MTEARVTCHTRRSCVRRRTSPVVARQRPRELPRNTPASLGKIQEKAGGWFTEPRFSQTSVQNLRVYLISEVERRSIRSSNNQVNQKCMNVPSPAETNDHTFDVVLVQPDFCPRNAIRSHQNVRYVFGLPHSNLHRYTRYRR